MASFNKVVLAGNLTQDPEFKELTSGTAVVNLRLAINENFKNRSGEMVENTCYLDVEAWGRQAETCRDYLHKGSAVLIEGRLKMDSWERDGKKFNKLLVNAERVQFLSPKGEAPPAASAPAPTKNASEPDPWSVDDEGEPPF